MPTPLGLALTPPSHTLLHTIFPRPIAHTGELPISVIGTVLPLALSREDTKLWVWR